MNTSLENLTHKMQRAAVGKMVDVVLSHADKDPEKTMGRSWIWQSSFTAAPSAMRLTSAPKRP